MEIGRHANSYNSREATETFSRAVQRMKSVTFKAEQCPVVLSSAKGLWEESETLLELLDCIPPICHE